MADPVVRLSCGDVHFDLAGLMSDEMAQIKAWTSLKNRAEFYDALRDEDPDAIVAAFSLVQWRATQTKPRWGDVKVNLDDLRWTRLVDERVVELMVERDADDKPLVVVVDKTGKPIKDGSGYLTPTGEDGERTGLAILEGPQGGLRWRFTDTGEEVPPTEPPATSGSTGSPSTETKPRRSA